jgi:signal peptidase I
MTESPIADQSNTTAVAPSRTSIWSKKIIWIPSILISIWIFLRIFFIQTPSIHTSSMRPTLFEGDQLFINKAAYWFKDIARNELIAFEQENLQTKKTEELAKRCVGLPGDTLTLRNAEVYINGKKDPIQHAIQFQYLLVFGEQLPTAQTIEQLEPAPSGSPAYGTLRIVFDPQKIGDLQKKIGISSISRITSDSSQYSPYVFPNSSRIKWNADQFGPLWIPKAGVSISLNDTMILLYKKIIEAEGHTLTQKNTSYYIDGEMCTSYTFLQNYYFVLGDNRYNSVDSRFFGFVSEKQIVGKISGILFTDSKTYHTDNKSRSFSFVH